MASGNPAFEEALEQCHQKWKNDARMFSSNTPEEVVAEIKALEAEENKGRVGRFSQRLDRLVKGFEGFFSAVDAFVSVNPQIAGLVWGGIRFVITVVSKYTSYFVKIVTVLETISDNLHFYHRYATAIYRESPRVMKALANVYDDILTVLMTVKATFFDSSGKKRGFFKTTAHVLNPWQTPFDEIIANFDRRRALLESEAKHEDRERDVEADQRRQMLHLRQRLQFEDSSCIRVHEAAQWAMSSNEDAGRWLLSQYSYKQWCEADGGDGATGLLWIHGNPGSGKTVLASIVIEDLKKRQRSNSAIIQFYCDYKVKEKADAENMLRSVLEQLLEGLEPPYSATILKILKDYSSKTFLSAILVLEIIGTVTKEYQEVSVVVDALDECQKRSGSGIFPLMRQLSGSVRLFVTSRDEQDIRMSLETYAKGIIPLTHENCIEDIRRYVLVTIEAYSHEDEATFLRQDSLKDEIVTTLLTQADGMFLWVHFQLLAIQLCATASQVRKTLRNLPDGLNKTFHRSLQTIDRLPDLQRDCVKRILRWVICAGSIPLEDLLTIVSVEDMGDTWEEDNIMRNGRKVIAHCAHLVSITAGENPNVVPTHNSVYLFLTSDPKLTMAAPSLPDYHIFPLSMGHDTCSHSLNKYLRLRPTPEAVEFARLCLTAWAPSREVDHHRHLWSLAFAAPEIDCPVLDFPTYPGIERVEAINCTFFQASDLLTVFPAGTPHRRVLLQGLSFNYIFPNAQSLKLVHGSSILGSSTASYFRNLPPNIQDTNIGSKMQYPDKDFPVDISPDGTSATVSGMDFILAKSPWNIVPRSAMFRNHHSLPHIEVPQLDIIGNSFEMHSSAAIYVSKSYGRANIPPYAFKVQKLDVVGSAFNAYQTLPIIADMTTLDRGAVTIVSSSFQTVLDGASGVLNSSYNLPLTITDVTLTGGAIELRNNAFNTILNEVPTTDHILLLMQGSTLYDGALKFVGNALDIALNLSGSSNTPPTVPVMITDSTLYGGAIRLQNSAFNTISNVLVDGNFIVIKDSTLYERAIDLKGSAFNFRGLQEMDLVKTSLLK